MSSAQPADPGSRPTDQMPPPRRAAPAAPPPPSQQPTTRTTAPPPSAVGPYPLDEGSYPPPPRGRTSSFMCMKNHLLRFSALNAQSCEPTMPPHHDNRKPARTTVRRTAPPSAHGSGGLGPAGSTLPARHLPEGRWRRSRLGTASGVRRCTPRPPVRGRRT